MPDDARRIAATAAVFASETRAAVLCALMSGTAHTQIELSRAVGVAPSSISEHVGILLDHGFVVIEAQGRHRYVRLAGPEIADLVERLSHGIRSAPKAALPKLPTELGFARSCYGHLAGALGVQVYESFTIHGWISDDGDHAALTDGGVEHLCSLGISAGAARRCLDWSQRRPHLGGPTGVALLSHCIDVGWLRRHPTRPRVLHLTDRGRREFPGAFRLELP